MSRFLPLLPLLVPFPLPAAARAQFGPPPAPPEAAETRAEAQGTYCATRFLDAQYLSVAGLQDVVVSCQDEAPRSFQRWGCYSRECRRDFLEQEVAARLEKEGLRRVATLVLGPEGHDDLVGIFKRGKAEADEAARLGLLKRFVRVSGKDPEIVSESFFAYLGAEVVRYESQTISSRNDRSRPVRTAAQHGYAVVGVSPMPNYYGQDEYLVLLKSR